MDIPEKHLSLMRQILINPFIFLLFFMFTTVGPAVAQNESIDSVETKGLEALATTLEDDTNRKALVQQIRALIAAQQAMKTQTAQGGVETHFFSQISGQIDKVSGEMVAAATILLDIPRGITWIQNALQASTFRSMLISEVGEVIIILLIGFGTYWVGSRLLISSRRTVESRVEDRIWLRIVLLALRTLLDLVPILAFFGAAYGALVVVHPEPITRSLTATAITAILISQIILVISRLVLAPRADNLRLIPIGDETANYIFVWIRRLTYLSIIGYFSINEALILGFPETSYDAFMKLLGFVIGLLLIMIILQNRHQVSLYIRGKGEVSRGNIRVRIAEIWHILLIFYLLAVYFVWIFEVAGGFQFALRATLLTVIIVTFSRLVTIIAILLIKRGFALSNDVKLRFPTLETRANLYLPWLQTGIRLVIYLFAFLAVLQAWGLGIFDWLTEPIGRAFLSKFFSIILIVASAIVVWELISAIIERFLQGNDLNGSAVARSQRVRTLLPLFRNFILVVLAVIVTMTVLTEVGVNIAPLLAGAGVVGLALGFGAQTLVKDVITGLLFLIEDAIAVGDVVELGGHSGVVEAVTVRSLRLRDLSGTVHQIPFSEVTSVVNMTKDFSFAVMDIGVAYREDVDEVIEVIKQIGAELRLDPKVSAFILEDIDVLGLDRFDDSAVVIRARIKTQPIKQWAVRRAFNRLLKQKFDKLGIEIPFPHQTLFFGVDKEGRSPSATVRLEPPTEE